MSTSRLLEARDAFIAHHPETRSVVNGRDWGTLRVGDSGPAVVLIPGTLGRSDIFFQQMQALEGEARILALSYPGSGTLEEWSQDVAELTRQAGFETATILGSSLGGYLVQRAAADHPALFTRLVAANTLADPSKLTGIPPYSQDLDAAPIADLRGGFLNGLANWTAMGGLHAELAAFLIAEAEGRILEDEMRARLKALKLAQPLPAQSLPHEARFTIESDDDHLIPAPIRQEVRDALEPARAYVFAEGTHFPYLSRPEAYTALLREVLGLPVDSPWPEGRTTRL
ncbi:alpha/beta fold hydrolase [Aquicoccus sp. SCR17]|nr:alpha/beta fold hydrolase [Carideicomes alvinocaridis]